MPALWPLTAAAVASLTGGSLVGEAGATCHRVTTDSRSGVRAGDLFVGLAGPHFDGSVYAADALDEGARVALVSRGASVEPPPGGAVVEVDDTLVALQLLAAEARRRFQGRVVAITGSNGKTVVKEMLAAALGTSLRLTASPMSWNSQVGVALSLLQLDPAAEVALVECGISEPGEMARLEAMVRPDAGILVHIGDAHLQGLGSRETTAREKALLFSRLPSTGWVLVLDDEELALEALRAVGAPARVVAREGARLLDADAPSFFEADAALAAEAALLLGADEEQLRQGLDAWRPAEMRLEMCTTPRGVVLINDAYTADPDSVEGALQVLRSEGRGGRRIAVLGGMAQLGVARQRAHERVGRRVVELGVDLLVGVGPGGAEIARAAVDAGMDPDQVRTCERASEAAQLLDEQVRPGDRVLLKGSRPARLERIAPVFFEAMSPARLTIDLDTLVDNLRAIQAQAPGRAVMGVVKSFGYGLGSVRLARTLERAGVEALAVAYPDEGVTLRDAGINCPILVQNVLEHEAHKLVRHALSAQLSTAAQARWLESEAQRQRRDVRVHLKVDTGMGRAGIAPAEALHLAQEVMHSPWLQLDGLMTHFAAADEPAHDDYTREQLARFSEVVSALEDAGIRPRWVHASNSAALVRFPEARFSMVRSGLGLLGYGGVPGSAPVLRLVTRVVSVKDLPAGHPVGYGLTWTAPEPRRIAVVALGYNDGYPWSLSNRGWMRVGRGRAPVVGRVCMDVTLVDVTGLGAVEPGDEVVVFGPGPEEPDLVALAHAAGTIPYEILTRLSTRLRRIFHSSL